MTIINDFFAFEISDSDESTRRDTAKENSSRVAVVECRAMSTGTGQTQIADALTFPITFLREPHFTTGSAVITNPDANIWHDPIGIAGVRSWKTDSKGHYIGAYLWTRVDMYPKGSDPGADLYPNATTFEAYLLTRPGLSRTRDQREARKTAQTLHYFTFTGLSYKDIPQKPKGAAMPSRRPWTPQ